MSIHKITIAFLALPLVAFIVMIVYSMLGNMGPHFTLPISGYDPRNLLYGHYINVTIDRSVEKQLRGQCGCVTSAGLEYKACEATSKNNCTVILNGKDDVLIKSLQQPVQLYVDETTASDIEKTIHESPGRLKVDVTLHENVILFHELLLDGKPVKTMPSPNPFGAK